MAPHFASELWSGFISAPGKLNDSGEIQWDRGVLEQKWPEIDRDYNMDLICEVIIFRLLFLTCLIFEFIGNNYIFIGIFPTREN